MLHINNNLHVSFKMSFISGDGNICSLVCENHFDLGTMTWLDGLIGLLLNILSYYISCLLIVHNVIDSEACQHNIVAELKGSVSRLKISPSAGLFLIIPFSGVVENVFIAMDPYRVVIIVSGIQVSGSPNRNWPRFLQILCFIVALISLVMHEQNLNIPSKSKTNASMSQL